MPPFRYVKDRWQRSELEAFKRAALDAARRGGAAGARVADAVRDEETLARLSAAFARGDLATWPYDDAYAAQAASPQDLLAGARSVVCVALPYRVRSRPPEAPLTGRVSSYAWSEDYHYRMRTLLQRIAAALNEAAGECVTALACDTKPLAERALSAQSGLTWIGKHTNAIHREFGSFVFLGEVVTTLPLPPDATLKTNCGSCAKCVDICPTGALRGDYTIDATRCISDLTQRKDAIPRALRPLVGTWVWGCDLCQDVCPPNERAQRSDDSRNEPLAAQAEHPPLTSLLRLRASEFKRLYARTAMGWRGAAILRRNAAVALGNARDRSSVGALAEALRDDPHPMVRGHAAWALGRIGSPRAIDALVAASLGEADPQARGEVIAALEPYRSGKALQCT